MVAFTGALSVTLKLSLFSNVVSLMMASVIVWLVTPAAKFSVPLSGFVPAAKSAPLVAVPLVVA